MIFFFVASWEEVLERELFVWRGFGCIFSVFVLVMGMVFVLIDVRGGGW